MKKICLVLFLAATLHFSSLGQNVRVGISGGLTVSDLTGPVNEMNHGVKTGFMAGLLVDVPLNAHFTFQPQLNYMQKGNLQREDANSKLYNALRYVELPFNLLYNLNTGKTVFFLGAGPSISLNVPSKKLTVPEEGESSYNDILFGDTPENDFRGIDWGANVLGGIRFSNKVQFAVSYNFGLRNLSTSADPESESIKSKCLTVQFSYIFNN